MYVNNGIRSVLYVLFFLACVGIDQLIKKAVVDQVALMSDGGQLIQLVNYRNTGIAFGIPFPSEILLGVICVVLVLLFVHYRTQFSSFRAMMPVLMVASGAVGNGIDRVVHGYVVDYVSIWLFPVFNFADVLIVCGIIMIGVRELLLSRQESKKGVE